MSYAFSMADMRTYLSYLRTKKQEILFDQAADGADDDGEATPDNKKKRTSDDEDMDATDKTDETEDDVDTM